MNLRNIYNLKIETGIAGGSISLWADEYQKDYLVGNDSVKKSDELVENISYLLEKNNVARSQLKKIVYSSYPVSQTGLKILRAVLKGFGTIFRAEIKERNLFDSIWQHYTENSGEKKIIILPVTASKQEFSFYDGNGEYNVKYNVVKDFDSEFPEGIFDENTAAEKIRIFATGELIERITKRLSTGFGSFLNDRELFFTELDENLSKYL